MRKSAKLSASGAGVAVGAFPLVRSYGTLNESR